MRIAPARHAIDRAIRKMFAWGERIMVWDAQQVSLIIRSFREAEKLAEY